MSESVDSQVLPAIIRSLISFPPDLIHQILNDLPIFKILGLAAYDVRYINDCILSHIRLREFFPSQAHLSSVCSFFKLFTDIFHGRVPASLSTYLSQALQATIATSHRMDLTPEYLTRQLRLSISHTLRQVGGHRISLLASFSPTPISPLTNWENPTLSSLQLYWTTLKHAQHVLNEIKSSQLRRLADLMTAHPHMLKMTMDPSQERRRNVAHLVGYLNQSAKNVHVHVLDRRIVARSLFIRFPLVPYDRYLRLFLKVIKRYPPKEICVAHTEPAAEIVSHDNLAMDQGNATGPLSNVLTAGVTVMEPQPSLTPASDGLSTFNIVYCEKSRSTHYLYPAVVVQNIVNVIDGMAYVYRDTSSLLAHSSPVIRTKYTPYSAPNFRSAGGLMQPMFVVHESRQKVEPPPLLEKELEWLTAFLDACKFMSGMEDAKWTSRETVAQMWKRMSD